MEGTTTEGIIPSLYQGQCVVRKNSRDFVSVKNLNNRCSSNTFDAQKSTMNLELFKHSTMFHCKCAIIEIVRAE